MNIVKNKIKLKNIITLKAGIMLTLLFLAALALVLYQKGQNFTSTAKAKTPTIKMWGQPVKGMYPHLTNPSYASKENASSFMQDNDEIIAIKSADGYKVFPNFILAFHHVVNDTINSYPISIAYCCQSDSAYAYGRKIDGKIYEFAPLGPMYFGNKVLYDLQTGSYWKQLTGEAFEGKLKGKKLEVKQPLFRSTWGRFKKLDNLQVLTPVKEESFYRNWFKKMRVEGLGLYALRQQKEEDKRLPPYTRGLGIRANSFSFYPLNSLNEDIVLNDTVAKTPILILFDKNLSSYRVFEREVQGKALTFERENEFLKDKETKSLWNNDGISIQGKMKGTALRNPVYTQVYWFVWSAFYPQTSIYQL